MHFELNFFTVKRVFLVKFGHEIGLLMQFSEKYFLLIIFNNFIQQNSFCKGQRKDKKGIKLIHSVN